MWTREGEDRKGHKKAGVSRRKKNGLREGEREGPLGLGRKHEERGGRQEEAGWKEEGEDGEGR
eukprot:3329626-Rhodomonas_salina.1